MATIAVVNGDPIICDHIRKEIKRLEGNASVYERDAADAFKRYRELRANVRECRNRIRLLKSALKGFGCEEVAALRNAVQP